MSDNASATAEPAELTVRVRVALNAAIWTPSGICSTRTPAGAPEGPHDADCQNREQVVAWWAGARAAGARAVVTEVTVGAGTLLVELEVTGTPAASEGAERRNAGRS